MPTNQEIKNWYNKRYSSQGKDSMRPEEAYPLFLDYLKVKKGKKLLDVSCGTGFLLKAGTQRGLDTSGTDISEEAVRIACQISPKSKIIVGRGEDLKFSNNEFDYVTCLGSLEHFLDMNKGLQEMRRVAKDSAKFCIMVPNSNFILWKLSKKQGTEQQDINEKLLSSKEWQNIFKKNGYKITKIYKDKWLSGKEKSKSSNSIKRFIFKFLWTIIPLNYTYQFIFILEKSK